MKEFWWACRDGRHQEVEQIMEEVAPQQLLQLLKRENFWKDGRGRSGLDWCLRNLEDFDEICMKTIVKHVTTTKDVKVITIVFPYAASVTFTDLVSEILQIVPITRELLEAKTNETKQTALEFCVVNNNLEPIRTIAEHIMENESDPASLSIVFPYTGYITSTNITCTILDKFQEQCDTLLKSLDFNGRTVLHAACNSGNKEVVIAVLPMLQKCSILRDELTMMDKTGRTPLCLAKAEQKQQYNIYFRICEVVESYEAYEARQETATAVLEWIQNHDPEIMDEVKKRLVLLNAELPVTQISRHLENNP